MNGVILVMVNLKQAGLPKKKQAKRKSSKIELSKDFFDDLSSHDERIMENDGVKVEDNEDLLIVLVTWLM